MDQQIPQRQYDLTLHLGADDWEALLNALHQIEYCLTVKREEGLHTADTVSGGYDSGWTLGLKHNPEMSHAEFSRALDEYIDSKQKTKQEDQ